jgi:hypothetical protein
VVDNDDRGLIDCVDQLFIPVIQWIVMKEGIDIKMIRAGPINVQTLSIRRLVDRSQPRESRVSLSIDTRDTKWDEL